MHSRPLLASIAGGVLTNPEAILADLQATIDRRNGRH